MYITDYRVHIDVISTRIALTLTLTLNPTLNLTLNLNLTLTLKRTDDGQVGTKCTMAGERERRDRGGNRGENKVGRRVSPTLAGLRSDPMLAFIYTNGEGEEIQEEEEELYRGETREREEGEERKEGLDEGKEGGREEGEEEGEEGMDEEKSLDDEGERDIAGGGITRNRSMPKVQKVRILSFLLSSLSSLQSRLISLSSQLSP
jgi:hypothetical protein